MTSMTQFGKDDVLVLNGTDIGDPEVLAMIQAFYSRSPMPILQRLASLNGDDKELKEEKIKEALKRFYVGYGHASIGDCGSATVFIENVSMLAAKVIQDDPLYNGQECSTRYIDFSAQPFLTATGSYEETVIAETWRAIYMKTLPRLKEWARASFKPAHVLSDKIIDSSARETAWYKTCDAIAFDVARGLLPCGASTSLAWTGTLRRLSDRCKEMAYHPLAEVRRIARAVYRSLVAKHPNSFKDEELNPNDRVAAVEHFYSTTDHTVEGTDPKITSVWYPECGGLFPEEKRAHFDRLFELSSDENNPRHVTRRVVDHEVVFNIRGQIDFGSFRDVQRHRRGLNRLPLVELELLHNYYSSIFHEVDEDLRYEIADTVEKAVTCNLDRVERQYLMPMATLVQVSQHWDLGQMKYVMGLRSKTSVHPTLREWTHKLHKVLFTLEGGHKMAAYCPIDTSPHYAASDRGEQTIKERK